ncbi:MAG: hypothetical protein IJN37_03630, partial [Clostridia bacterium]|nr:hypothetical protein [Clostridia bacterium]
MTAYEKYKNSGITLECAGFDERGENIPYFCTPADANILGRPGVDGIHFCFVPEYGETVFCISPMNGAEDAIHVVSNNFTDFLSLL